MLRLCTGNWQNCKENRDQAFQPKLPRYLQKFFSIAV